ncbi:MAG: sigma-70 family RNA polymerase sigma factor [Woeseia sp.]
MLERTGPNDKTSGEGRPDVAGWYDQYHGRLLKYLRGSLRTESDAQDVSQEVFLRLLRMPEDRVIGHPRAYLFRVAANVVNDWRAGQKMFETRAPEDLDQVPGPGDCDEDYDHERRKNQINEAIRLLPVHCRAALLLSAQHGMTYPEIATYLNVSERMVKRYIVKAYARLREDLSALEYNKK